MIPFCQVGVVVPWTLPQRLLEDPTQRARFKTWLIAQLRLVAPRCMRMSLGSTIELKAKGLTAAGVTLLSQQSP